MTRYVCNHPGKLNVWEPGMGGSSGQQSDRKAIAHPAIRCAIFYAMRNFYARLKIADGNHNKAIASSVVSRANRCAFFLRTQCIAQSKLRPAVVPASGICAGILMPSYDSRPLVLWCIVIPNKKTRDELPGLYLN